MKINKLAIKRQIMDPWNIPILILIVSFSVFLLYPIFMVIKSSFINGEGSAFSIQGYVKFFTVSYYYKALLNTIFLGIAGTAGIMTIVLPLAYLYSKYKIFGHSLVGTALWIPYLTPAFIGAYTWLILFGKYGLLTIFFKNIGIMIPSIGGLSGVLTVFILTYYPLGFILLVGAFQTIDPSLEEAAHNLGASDFRRFWTVTVPSVTPSILNASLLVFILIIDSFGIPAVIGVGTPVLTTLVFGEFTSEMGGPPVMAATGATILLLISMSILIIQRVYLQRRSFVSKGSRSIQMIDPKPMKKLLLSIIFGVILIFSLLPIFTIILSSFTVAEGPVMRYGQFTLDHYKNTFYAVLRPLKNSYILATISMILDLTLGSLIGYVIIRKGKRLATFIDAFVALPLGVPGVLLGIGLILGFSRGSLVLVGTSSILIVAYFVRRLPHPVRTVSAILSQVDENIEEASVNLGVPPIKTFMKVTSRMIFPGIAAGGLLAWTSSISDLTCTILIYPARWKTLTVETFAQISSDLYGPASVVGIFLLISVMVPIFIVNTITNRKQLLKNRDVGTK